MGGSAGIAGTGLIGASIGLGLRSAGWSVSGWDPDRAALDAAVDRGAVEAGAPSLSKLVEAGSDLLILAAPLDSVIVTLDTLRTSGLVIDVAGVKQPVLRAARHLEHFVGTHPMAGREVSGTAAASGELFRGAAWIVAVDGADDADLDEVDAMILDLGARSMRMTAAAHDATVASVSHVPQVLAAALLAVAARRPEAMDLAAGSFRDLTRVAASSPQQWERILVANREEVAAAAGLLVEELDALVKAMGEDGRELREGLESAREIRSSLGPHVGAVRIALADEPGELARVGSALESSSVDVRDLQLRHAPFGGGGILTVSVRRDDAAPLRSALRAQNLLVVD